MRDLHADPCVRNALCCDTEHRLHLRASHIAARTPLISTLAKRQTGPEQLRRSSESSFQQFINLRLGNSKPELLRDLFTEKLQKSNVSWRLDLLSLTHRTSLQLHISPLQHQRSWFHRLER